MVTGGIMVMEEIVPLGLVVIPLLRSTDMLFILDKYYKRIV
jgi:hypothetical protein